VRHTGGERGGEHDPPRGGRARAQRPDPGALPQVQGEEGPPVTPELSAGRAAALRGEAGEHQGRGGTRRGGRPGTQERGRGHGVLEPCLRNNSQVVDEIRVKKYIQFT
jgi:hypothetical protein